MHVSLRYIGYCPQRPSPYLYLATADNGCFDYFEERNYISNTDIEVDDNLFNARSGWALMRCDDCGYEFTERTWPGSSIQCPVCGYSNAIPEDAELYDAYNRAVSDDNNIEDCWSVAVSDGCN